MTVAFVLPTAVGKGSIREMKLEPEVVLGG